MNFQERAKGKRCVFVASVVFEGLTIILAKLAISLSNGVFINLITSKGQLVFASFSAGEQPEFATGLLSLSLLSD